MRKYLFGLALFGITTVPVLSVPVLAADATPASKPANAAPEKPKETINAGELRLDGKLKALLGEGTWELETQSWTSPRNVTTSFDELKNKNIQVAPDAYIHPRGEPQKVALHDVKLGTHLAVIGKNGADGVVQVREVILLEGYGSRREVGMLLSNPYSLALVKQSRDAREAGLFPKALSLIDNAIATAKGMGDLSGEGLASQDRAGLLVDLERYDEAMVAFQRVTDIGRNLNNALLISMGLNGVGSLQRAAGKLPEAISTLKEADQISAQSEPEIHISVLDRLADAYLSTGQIPEAVEILQRLQPLEDAAGKDAEGGNSLLTIALLQAVDAPDNARAVLKQAQPRIDNARDPKEKSELLGYEGFAQWRLGDTDAARQNFEKAAVIDDGLGSSDSAKYWRSIPDRLTNVGNDLQAFWTAIRKTDKEPAQTADGQQPGQTNTPPAPVKPDDATKPAAK